MDTYYGVRNRRSNTILSARQGTRRGHNPEPGNQSCNYTPGSYTHQGLQCIPQPGILPRTLQTVNHSGIEKARETRLLRTKGLQANRSDEHTWENHGHSPSTTHPVPIREVSHAPTPTRWWPQTLLMRARYPHVCRTDTLDLE